jgi:2-C-methyl-D-erythritol 4-phosphate cytidylyltransferase
MLQHFPEVGMKEADNIHASAIIVAGGRGSRMNMDINKQYIEICGKPLLSWTIQAFEECPAVKDIILVTSSQDIPFCKQEIVDAFEFKKVGS